MLIIKDAEYIDGYRLRLKFNDGVEKIVNLKAKLEGEIFELLKDFVYFADFKVDSELDTIVWKNGADFAPEFLYGLDMNLA